MKGVGLTNGERQMSKTNEKLTDEERRWLESDPEFQMWDVRRKVLRIIDALTAENAQLRAGHEQALNERDAAHNAMAEWGRMRNEAYTLYRAEGAKRDAAEARLATAEGLLRTTLHSWSASLADDVEVFHARRCQPAAPSLGHPGADEVFARLRAARQSAARTEAEQAVLDAWSAVHTDTLYVWATHPSERVRNTCRAELARRGLR